MADQRPSARVVGKTLRWTLTEGPQAGKTYEHTFHPDGTVQYRIIEETDRDPSADVRHGPRVLTVNDRRMPRMRCRRRSTWSRTEPTRDSP